MFYAEDALGNRGATVTAEIDVSGGGGLADWWWIIIIIVVVIIVLLLLFKKYQAKSKTSEAKLQLAGKDGEGAEDDGSESEAGDTPSGPQAKGNSPTHVGSGPKPTLSGSGIHPASGDDVGVMNPTTPTPPGNLPPIAAPTVTLEVKKPGTGP
jgi:hypothetical protein